MDTQERCRNIAYKALVHYKQYGTPIPVTGECEALFNEECLIGKRHKSTNEMRFMSIHDYIEMEKHVTNYTIIPLSDVTVKMLKEHDSDYMISEKHNCVLERIYIDVVRTIYKVDSGVCFLADTLHKCLVADTNVLQGITDMLAEPLLDCGRKEYISRICKKLQTHVIDIEGDDEMNKLLQATINITLYNMANEKPYKFGNNTYAPTLGAADELLDISRKHLDSILSEGMFYYYLLNEEQAKTLADLKHIVVNNECIFTTCRVGKYFTIAKILYADNVYPLVLVGRNVYCSPIDGVNMYTALKYVVENGTRSEDDEFWLSYVETYEFFKRHSLSDAVCRVVTDALHRSAMPNKKKDTKEVEE